VTNGALNQKPHNSFSFNQATLRIEMYQLRAQDILNQKREAADITQNPL
jgi:hypothetical protein